MLRKSVRPSPNIRNRKLETSGVRRDVVVNKNFLGGFMPAEYKKCPFCGSDKIEYGNDVGPNDEGFWEWIECTNCGAKCPDAETWNRRAE